MTQLALPFDHVPRQADRAGPSARLPADRGFNPCWRTTRAGTVTYNQQYLRDIGHKTHRGLVVVNSASGRRTPVPVDAATWERMMGGRA